jgi:hypothetical protein
MLVLGKGGGMTWFGSLSWSSNRPWQLGVRVRAVGSEKDERGEQGGVAVLSALHTGTKARENDGRPSSEMVGRSAHMVDTSRTRVVQCGTSSDTWRAAKRAKWDAFLGHFRADLGLAPKIKVEAHE